MQTWIDIFSALLTPVTAVTAVLALIINWRQKKLNQTSLELALFKERFQYFLAVREILIRATAYAHVDKREIVDLGMETSGVRFLFGKAMASHVKKRILDPAEELGEISTDIEKGKLSDEELNNKSRRKHEIIKQLRQERTSLEEIFGEYLSIHK